MTLKSLAGGRVFAEVVGQGSPLVVLLHGWGRDRSDLRAATNGLPGRHAFVDLPGFGASPPPQAPWGAHEYAALLDEAITDLLLREPERSVDRTAVLLVGHSFGGRVAVCLAAERPWVSGLLLSGVPLLRRESRRPALRFRAIRALHHYGLISDSTMETWRERYGSSDYSAARGLMRQVLVRVVAESYERELAAVQCPVRLLWGELDTAAPVDMAREAARMVRAPLDLVVVPGVGHDVHRARPDLFAEELLNLYDRTR